MNATRYDNFQPNSRIAPAPAQNIKDELTAIFPTSFNAAGQDYQHLKTSGYELELIANLTRNWRLILNGATNQLVTEERLPLLHGFQAQAKTLNKPTPLLDAFLLTFPEEFRMRATPKPARTFSRATNSPPANSRASSWAAARIGASPPSAVTLR
jgi:hypothetical protein